MPDDLPEMQPGVAPRESALPTVPLANQAIGQPVGNAMENLGEVASKIHHDAYDAMNQARVLDAHNQLQQWSEANLYNPTTGLFAQNLGKDAGAAVQKTRSAYQEQVATIAGSLTTPQQQQQFQAIALHHQWDMNQHLDAYESRQNDDYKRGVYNATLQLQATAAVNHANAVAQGPFQGAERQRQIAAAADNAIDIGTASITDHARDQGWSPEQTQATIGAYRSQTHAAVISAALSQGRDQDAQAYYDQHRDQLQGEQADQAARMVEAGSTAGQAVRAAPGYVYDSTGGINPTAIEDILRDPALQANPRLREATVQQAQQLIGARNAARGQQAQATFDATWHLVDSGVPISDPRVAAAVATLPPEYASQIEAHGQRVEKPIDPKASADVLHSFRLMEQQDPQRFLALDLRTTRGGLLNEDYRALLQDQIDLAHPSATNRGSPIVTRFINDAMKMNGIDAKSPDAGAFDQSVRREIDALGGWDRLGDDGVQRVIDRSLIQRATGNWIFGRSAPTYALSDEQVLAQPITRDQQQRAEAILRAHGKPAPSAVDVARLALMMP